MFSYFDKKLNIKKTMGNSSEPQWKGYDDQLFKDSKQRTFFVPNSSKDGKSPIIRNFSAKDGFVGFLKDKNSGAELDTIAVGNNLNLRDQEKVEDVRDSIVANSWL